MNATVRKIADDVRSLPEKELDEFLSWLAEYELSQPDPWDEQIERDASDGRLDAVLKRVRDDIQAGRTKPLDEVVREFWIGNHDEYERQLFHQTNPSPQE